MKFWMVTLGAVPFSEIFSRSTDHWNRRLLIIVGLIVESQLATKIRSRVTAVPLAEIDSLFCVLLVR